MKIFQHIDEYHPFDGIGNDCRGFRSIFNISSTDNYVVTQRNFCSKENKIILIFDFSKELINQLEINHESIHILHYGGSGYPLDFFLSLPGRKFLRFHNVTPPEFYLGCNEAVYVSMDKFFTKSILELFSLSNEIELAICDSNTNANFLKNYSSIPTMIVPILKDYSKILSNKDRLQSSILNNQIKSKDLVFVGRIVPNKKIQDIITIFYFWKKYHPASKLHLIGGLVPGIEDYFDFLKDYINELDLKEDIEFYFKIDELEKTKILSKSLFYISMSEHEGFGIPLLEAMQNQIVVIAFASTAIPETLKKGGILIYKKDFPQIAELMNQILEKPDLYSATLKTQERALDFYRNYPFQEKLENIFFKQERVNL